MLGVWMELTWKFIENKFLLLFFFLYVIPVLVSYFYTKLRNYNTTLHEHEIDNLLSEIGIQNINFPIIFISQEENNIYVNNAFNSIEEFRKDIFLNNDISDWGILYGVDSDFNKIQISYRSLDEILNQIWINSKKIEDFKVPIFKKTNEKISFEYIENILCDKNCPDEYFVDNEVQDYKNKLLPKNMDTIIKIINYDI